MRAQTAQGETGLTPFKPLVLITIDGPAGAGKSTVARQLAQSLGYKYIDTGALYRGVALAAMQANVRTDDDPGLQKICQGLKLEFVFTPLGLRLMANGQDISDQIREPVISMQASAVSARPCVRAFLLEVQRRMGSEKGAVFEGRDMGTVVFPDADIKFFLDGDPKIRAKRRYLELEGSRAQSLEDVERDMARRDANDRSREIAPLKPADDARIIDTSRLSIAQVIEQMLAYIKSGRA